MRFRNLNLANERSTMKLLTHHASRTTHHASRITHHASPITHHASFPYIFMSTNFIYCPLQNSYKISYWHRAENLLADSHPPVALKSARQLYLTWANLKLVPMRRTLPARTEHEAHGLAIFYEPHYQIL